MSIAGELKKRDTVAVETPAAAAISSIVVLGLLLLFRRAPRLLLQVSQFHRVNPCRYDRRMAGRLAAWDSSGLRCFDGIFASGYNLSLREHQHTPSPARRFVRAAGALSLAAAFGSVVYAVESAPGGDWWQAGTPRVMPATVLYPNSTGIVKIFNAQGAFETKGHPFFTPLGANGRACITCHQPASAMGLSAESVRQRWEETGGKDPLFAAIDGSNCPSLPQSGARLAFAAIGARAVSRLFAMAAARHRRRADRTRVLHRGGARSDRLQHGSRLWAEQQKSRHLRISPAAAGGKP